MIDNPKAARELTYAPEGHRGLGRCLHESARAYLFEYYSHELWIPKKVLVKAEGSYWAPRWAIKTAKKFNQSNKPVIYPEDLPANPAKR